MMPKRKPLSMLIAIDAGKKRPGGDGEEMGGMEEGDDDTPEGGKYDDPGMINAAEDAIDAFKNRDAKAFNRALCDWAEMHKVYEDEAPSEEKSDGETSEHDDY